MLCYVLRCRICSVLLLWVYIPHQASWKISLTTVGIEPATFGLLVQWNKHVPGIQAPSSSLFFVKISTLSHCISEAKSLTQKLIYNLLTNFFCSIRITKNPFWVYKHFKKTENAVQDTVEPVLSGRTRGFCKWPLNTGWPLKAAFPLGEFVRANKQKVNVIGWWCRLCLSLANQVAFFSVRANKFA